MCNRCAACLINSIPSVKLMWRIFKIPKTQGSQERVEWTEEPCWTFLRGPIHFLATIEQYRPKSFLYGPPQFRDKGPEPCVCGGILLAGTWCLAHPLALARGPRCDLLTPHLTRARPVQSPQLNSQRQEANHESLDIFEATLSPNSFPESTTLTIV